MKDPQSVLREEILSAVRRFAEIEYAGREFVPGSNPVPVSGKGWMAAIPRPYTTTKDSVEIGNLTGSQRNLLTDE